MTAALVFRAAVPDDAERISQLAMRSKAHWGYSDEFMDACRDELTFSAQAVTAAGRHFELALANGEIAGFYALEDQRGDEIELGAMFVEPARIGTGVGRHLMGRAVEHAARLGACRMLIVADPNAVAFYQAAGAVRRGECASASIRGRKLPRLYLDVAGGRKQRGGQA